MADWYHAMPTAKAGWMLNGRGASALPIAVHPLAKSNFLSAPQFIQPCWIPLTFFSNCSNYFTNFLKFSKYVKTISTQVNTTYKYVQSTFFFNLSNLFFEKCCAIQSLSEHYKMERCNWKKVFPSRLTMCGFSSIYNWFIDSDNLSPNM